MKLKTALAAIGMVATLGAAAGASAATFPDFTFNPQTAAAFTADKITGNYTEVVTFDGAGNFYTSILWQAGQFVKNDGNTPITAGTSRLGVDYGMYALLQATGTYAPNGSGGFNFSFNYGASALSVFIDDNVNTSFTAPGFGFLPWTIGGNGDDILIAGGDLLNGSGNLIGGCSGINCGSFGTMTTFNLTLDGKNWFTAPNPFYQFSFQSGQLNSFDVTGTQQINGSLDVVFQVPEPATTALIGIGLLGVGLGARRRKAK